MQTVQATLVRRELSSSGDVALVYFQSNTIFPFLEGQFVMISSISRTGKPLKKPYSIATTSSYFANEKEIGCVVKKVGTGGMSEHLVSELSLGGSVTLQGPVGHYVDSKQHTSYLFISVGSGFSPNVGLFDALIQHQSFSQITILHGERYFSHHVSSIHTRFTEISQSDERVTYIPIFSKEKNLPIGGKSGYVQDHLDAVLQKCGPNTSCFLCGKPEMVDEVRTLLQERGIEKEDISFEKY